MRIFAISDLHIDYHQNYDWVKQTSRQDYQDDILLLAGDISDRMSRLKACFTVLARCFKTVMFVPGNHELWTRLDSNLNSIEKFDSVIAMAQEQGIDTSPCKVNDTLIVPLNGWYDYSFGTPSEFLKNRWMDFKACDWPEGFSDQAFSRYLLSKNHIKRDESVKRVITFSHFLPRIDLIPKEVPDRFNFIHPVMGSIELDKQLRSLGSKVHVYGHSHIARDITIDGVRYVNSALGTPKEDRYTAHDYTLLAEI